MPDHPRDVGPRELEVLQKECEVLQRRLAEVERELIHRKRSEEKYRLATESLPTAMVMVDQHGRIVLVNMQTERLFGYARERLIGEFVELLIPESSRRLHPDYRRSYMASPEARPMGVGRDLYARRSDGTVFPVEIGLTPLETDDGSFVLSAIVDITERKRAEERFRLAVESAPNAMLMIDEHGASVLANSQAEHIFDYRREDLVGSQVDVLVPDRYRNRHADHRRQFFLAPEARPMGVGRDLHAQRRDGTEFPVEIGLTPIRTSDGIFALASVLDLSQRRRGPLATRAESLPHDSGEVGADAVVNYRKLFEAAPGLFLVLTPDLRIVAVSQRYLEATMTLRDEIIGRKLFDVFPDNPADPTATGTRNLRASLQRVLTDEVPDAMAVQKYDIRRPRSEGGLFEERYWSPVNSPVFDDQGKLILIIHRVEDVTDFVRLKQQDAEQRELTDELRRRYEQMEAETFLRAQQLQESNRELRAMNDTLQSEINERTRADAKAETLAGQLHQKNLELENSNRELEAFSYSVSHDLRAPLRAIDGFSRILLSEFGEVLPSEAQEYLQDVRAGSQRMGQLVDHLLAFSKLTRHPINRRRIQPRRIIQECLQQLENQREGRNIELRIGDLADCWADEVLLKQVWLNLLDNAFKYTATRPKATIEIAGRQGNSSDEQVYFVKDNGVGFDMRYAHRLFGVFQRLHRAEDFAGTGVGLAIIQRIVHRHGGRVWTESQVNQGATFFFTLPKEGVADE